MWYLYINKGVWDDLSPPAEQKALQDAATALEQKKDLLRQKVKKKAMKTN